MYICIYNEHKSLAFKAGFYTTTHTSNEALRCYAVRILSVYNTI